MPDIHEILLIIVSLIGGGGLVAYIKARSENRVNDADAWAKLVTQLEQRVTRLSDRVEKLEKELDAKDAIIEAQEKRIDELEAQNTAKDSQIAELAEKVRVLENRRK